MEEVSALFRAARDSARGDLAESGAADMASTASVAETLDFLAARDWDVILTPSSGALPAHMASTASVAETLDFFVARDWDAILTPSPGAVPAHMDSTASVAETLDFFAVRDDDVAATISSAAVSAEQDVSTAAGERTPPAWPSDASDSATRRIQVLREKGYKEGEEIAEHRACLFDGETCQATPETGASLQHDGRADTSDVGTGASATRDGCLPAQTLSLEDLPLELLAKIVSLLPLKQQLSTWTVSNRWSEAVDFHLRKFRKFHIDYPEELDDSDLELLLRSMPNLRSITFREKTEDEYLGIKEMRRQFSLIVVLKCCPHLEEVDLHWFRLDVTLLRQLGSACPQLRAMKLPSEADDACLNHLLSHLTGLLSLELICTRVKGRRFSLLPKLPMLSGPLDLEDINLQTLFMEQDRETQLDTVCRSDQGVAGELQCSHLTSTLTDCPRLERLSMTYRYGEQTGWLRQLSHCPQLSQLRLSSSAYEVRYSDEDLAAVLAACSRLQRLSLAGCRFDGSTWLRQVSARCPQCPQLKELHLSTVSNIEPSDLAEGLAGCVELERLALASLQGPNGALLLLERCLPPPDSLSALRHLSVTKLQLTDSCLQQLTSMLPELRTLELSVIACGEPTEKGWIECLPRLRHLQALKLVLVAGVSDTLLDWLHDLPLRKLSYISADERSTPDAICRLVESCRSLKYLYLGDLEVPFWRQLVEQLPADRDVTIAVSDFNLHELPPPPPGSIRLRSGDRVPFEDL